MARWDELFADLEGQLDAEEAVELAAEVSELQVAAWGRTGWLDRARGRLGEPMRVRLVDGSVVRGPLDSVGPDWLLIGGADTALVPAAAVVEVGELAARASPEPSAVLARLGLPHALRRLARQAEPVLVISLGAPPQRGRIVRVGLDHIDLVADDAEPGIAPTLRTVTFAGLVTVRPV